jgi:hypothetical protein
MGEVQWLTSIIPATLETQIRRIMVLVKETIPEK